MAEPSRGFKSGSILLALLIGGVIIVLAGSAILPSTKRARIDLDEVRGRVEEDKAATEAETQPATVPATVPSMPVTEPTQK